MPPRADLRLVPPALPPVPTTPGLGRPLPQHLAFLRDRLRPVPRHTAVLPFGDPGVDACLPGGGLPLGALHEVAASGRGAETGELQAAFAAVLLGRIAPRKPVLWVAPVADLYPPGLPGLNPARLILASPRDDAGVLAAMETGLREGGLAAVVGEIGNWGAAGARVASRRLVFACEQHAATSFVLRRFPYGGAREDRQASAAATRWRLAPAPGSQWRVELEQARGGRPGAWLMEVADDETNPLRVVAALVDHAVAPTADPQQAAGYG